jgi:hypothetical protein
MKRITLTLVAILLAVPVAASAKVGVELQGAPEKLQPGDTTDMTVMLMREDGQLPSGARPLVTFTNAATGERLLVRGSRSVDGISHAKVAFPSRGHWDLEISGVRGLLEEGPQGFSIGTAATAVDASPAEDGPSFPAVSVAVALGVLMLGAATVLLLRRPEGAA